MKRRFRVTIGEKNFVVEVEEINVEKETSTTGSTSQMKAQPTNVIEEVKPRVEAKEVTIAEGGVVRAPLPGTVVSVKCRLNERVEAGTPLLILEAMKMENEIFADKSGIVKKIEVSEGIRVSQGDVLVIIE